MSYKQDDYRNDYQESFSSFKGVGKMSNKTYRLPAVKPAIPVKSSVFNVTSNVTVHLKTGDIVNEHGLLIVNTANQWLQDGSGVTGAIFHEMANAVPASAAYDFEDACESFSYIPPGMCALVPTPQHPHIPGIIHLVGMPYYAARNAVIKRLYTEAIFQACDIAVKNNLPIAFPSLGTGVYAVPTLLASEWFIRAIWQWSEDHPQDTLSVVKVIYDLEMWHVYRSVWLDWSLEKQQIGG